MAATALSPAALAPLAVLAIGFVIFCLGQLGTLVVVVVVVVVVAVAAVAAASLSIEARPGLAAFYRTRLRRPTRLLLHRYLTVVAATIVTLALGTVGAWYETRVLLGAISVSDVPAGFGLEALWLCFVTSVVAAFTSAMRTVAAVVGSAIASLLALALLGRVSALSPWLPTRLADGVAALVQPGKAADVWRPMLVAGAASLVLVCLAVIRLGKREL